MKIAVFDPYMPKFFGQVVDRWSDHDVKYERYYDPSLVEWADVVWFETCDNNLHVATTGDLPDGHDDDWDMHNMDLRGKKIIVRVIDIEAWYGHHLAVKWDVVTDVVFIAPHIQEMVNRDISISAKQHLIPCGVDVDKFEFVDKPYGKKIAWVCEKWPTKGIDYALQIMAALPKDYELHALGPWNDRYAWEEAYQNDFIEKSGIKFFDYDWVDDIVEFYKDKDFILSCSKKEGFGYSIAEGMSCGLQPVIHEFYGCGRLWDKWTWATIEQAVDLIQSPDSRKEFPQYLESKGYRLEDMINSIERIINA